MGSIAECQVLAITFAQWANPSTKRQRANPDQTNLLMIAFTPARHGACSVSPKQRLRNAIFPSLL